MLRERFVTHVLQLDQSVDGRVRARARVRGTGVANSLSGWRGVLRALSLLTPVVGRRVVDVRRRPARVREAPYPVHVRVRVRDACRMMRRLPQLCRHAERGPENESVDGRVRARARVRGTGVANSLSGWRGVLRAPSLLPSRQTGAGAGTGTGTGAHTENVFTSRLVGSY